MSKIKNKHVQRTLNSNIADYVAEDTPNQAKNKLSNLFGGILKEMTKEISNFQIENAIESIDNEDLNDNFVGVFLSIHLNKFVNHAAMISEKKCKYTFVIVSNDTSEKEDTHCWSILDIEPKTDIFSSILLDLTV